MRQIADAARVSIGTVSNVLNGKARVRPELVARVQNAIDRLGYRPSQLGRGLRRRQTDIVGMIIPDISNPFFPSIVRGVEDAIFAHGRQIILCNSDNDPEKQRAYLDVLRSYRPAGLIVISTDQGPFPAAADLSFPVVCIDRKPHAWQGDSVVSANREGGAQAAEHLLALGHKRFAVITGPAHLAPSQDRVAGFLERVRLDGPAASLDIRVGQFDRMSGYAATADLLSNDVRPTAIFAANDMMATGVLLAVREAGLACPGAISIMGFDDLDIAELTEPPLTSIRQSGHALGQAAAQVLHRRLAGDDEGPIQIVLPTTLCVRRSTGRAPT